MGASWGYWSLPFEVVVLLLLFDGVQVGFDRRHLPDGVVLHSNVLEDVLEVGDDQFLLELRVARSGLDDPELAPVRV
jgi:hypothetical protein